MLQVLYLFMLQGFSLILNGLFIKVNINLTDFSLLKGLISGLLQSILESSSGIPMWNPYVESPYGIPMWNPYVECLCGIPCGIPMWNPCLKTLLTLEITANFSGSKFYTQVIPEWKKSSIILNVLLEINKFISSMIEHYCLGQTRITMPENRKH